MKERSITPMSARTLILLAFLAQAACGGAAIEPAMTAHDVPVPAGEPRQELHLRVELAPAQGCEEAFDLAMYKDLGVDLVQWDANVGACSGRVVVIRFLPKKTSAEKVMSAARALAKKVDPVAKK
jgi:hypothetical protein